VTRDVVWNERLKLGAAALNNIATAAVGIGVLAPLAALVYANRALQISGAFGLTAVLWLLLAAVFYSGAQRLLGGLRG